MGENESAQINPISLMIIGAEKAGTTALIRYLGQHPGVDVHSQREMSYFLDDDQYMKGLSQAYTQYFPNHQWGEQLIFAKSVGIMYSSVAMDRLYEHNPKIHLILLLRDPIQRAYSGFWEAKRKGLEVSRTFEEAVYLGSGIINIESDYIQRSLYYLHVSKLLERFSRSQIACLFFEEFIKDPLIMCFNIFSKFPSLAPGFVPNVMEPQNIAVEPRSPELARILYSKDRAWISKQFIRLLIPGSILDVVRDKMRRWNEFRIEKPSMNADTYQDLSDFFENYNEELGKMLGMEISVWNSGGEWIER